ncbi:MAG: D-alanine--D-alanine ligase [Candidatus Omnitrophota bacterium]
MAVKNSTKDKGLRIKFGKIGVLMGGPSSEREISLKSGKAVYQALSNANLDVVAMDIQTDDIKDNIARLKSKKIDCAFIALHGRFGEDGTIQAILEDLNIAYTGSGVEASRLAMDKAASRKVFQAHGLHVPKCEVVTRCICVPIPLPLVVKPAAHGSSIGLSIIERQEDLDKAINLALSFDERAIIEEYIFGREVTVGILADEPLPVIEIIPKKRFFDYEAKYQAGLTVYQVPAKLPGAVSDALKETASLAHKALGCCGCSRVDMILNSENIPVVLELNSIPGLTGTSLLPKAAKTLGIDFLSLCLKLLELAYEKAQSKTPH